MIIIEIIKIQDEEYPEGLLQIENPPKQLYVEGNKKILKNNLIIAIVGSRKETPYGKKYAKLFAKELSKQGITIISGMAIGIDTTAHINSMKQMGKTIAVLGSGFNHVSPKENYYLYDQIIQNGGCVISEYEPETIENKANYPRRNRIISGIATGVIIVEASYRSGSTITAKLAIKQKKEVFCIPNKLGEKNSYGTNMLIKNGANLLTCPEDIIEYYNLEKTNEEIMQIPKQYKEIYELIGELPISINELSKLSKQTIAQTTESLCMLEIQGLIKSVAGSKYKKAEGK